ncbi:RNA-binding domain-containing protein [Raoultibacter phocaeensis]|uniref:RNA-binding domain-containing protein n=1 Tax=Raoultibacter phocaeensis TaxID=2479841 RepID=UPI00111B1A4C|nr:RNA-binding domain-containing protein [Raoultibacter phocaeensis]
MKEGVELEFKREWSDAAKKTVVAFANTKGGTLLVGVTDDGEIIGVEDPDQCMVSIMQSIGNAIKPDVSLFTQIRIEQVESKNVVAVEVQRGSSRPYYLSDKGLRPTGVYVRQGALSAPASEAAILSMIKESSGDAYEDARSLVQELTFQEASEVFSSEGIAFEKRHMRTLGLIAEDGTFTNLALLLSDQCPATTKAAVFQGTTKAVFRNRYEFTGSLFRQFREVLDFIDRYNETASTIGDDMKRIDKRAYPEYAVRESLLNMVVHRDYSLAGPALISVFDDRTEFLNLGGLPSGISERDMMMGVSLQRNPKLARVLYQLKWIESYGTGIPKIMESYGGSDESPTFLVSDNAFKVTLPSLVHDGKKAVEAARFERESVAVFHDRSRETPNVSVAGDPREAVLELVAAHGSVARKDIQAALGISQSAAIRLLNALMLNGSLRKTGTGKNTRYSM